MNRHQYPKIGSQRSYPLRNGKRQKGPPCIVCGVESWCKVILETSHMRGDDEVVHACVGHKDDASALWAAFEKRQKERQPWTASATSPLYTGFTANATSPSQPLGMRGLYRAGDPQQLKEQHAAPTSRSLRGNALGAD